MDGEPLPIDSPHCHAHVVQDGTDGINAIFHAENFSAVAALLKPRKRRKLSNEQIAERSRRLRKYQFTTASQSEFNGRRRDPTAWATQSPISDPISNTLQKSTYTHSNLK